jgi:hypothetical protein
MTSRGVRHGDLISPIGGMFWWHKKPLRNWVIIKVALGTWKWELKIMDQEWDFSIQMTERYTWALSVGDGNNSVWTNSLGLQVQSVVASDFFPQGWLEGLYQTLGELA